MHVMGWLEKQNKGSFVGNVNDGKCRHDFNGIGS